MLLKSDQPPGGSGAIPQEPATSSHWYLFPHAGGSSSFYRRLASKIGPAGVTVLDYPGHGTKLADEPLARVADLAQHLLPEVLACKTRPALVGHSFGSIVAFEVGRLLEQQGIVPATLIVSACPPSWGKASSEKLHTSPDLRLVQELSEHGVTPRELLAEPEFLQLILRAYRADLTALETWVSMPSPTLRCRIVAASGLNDRTVSRSEMMAWSNGAAGRFEFHEFEGGHFYLVEHDSFAIWLQNFQSEVTAEA